MNFDPQKFFIGLMDFFSILLPGALLTYLLMGEVGPVVLGNRYAKLADAEAWADFLFASYLFNPCQMHADRRYQCCKALHKGLGSIK